MLGARFGEKWLFSGRLCRLVKFLASSMSIDELPVLEKTLSEKAVQRRTGARVVDFGGSRSEGRGEVW